MEIITFLKKLPLEVALVCWDVLNGNISEATQTVADESPDYDSFEILHAVVGGNLEEKEALTEYCKGLIDEMIKEEKWN